MLVSLMKPIRISVMMIAKNVPLNDKATRVKFSLNLRNLDSSINGTKVWKNQGNL